MNLWFGGRNRHSFLFKKQFWLAQSCDSLLPCLRVSSSWCKQRMPQFLQWNELQLAAELLLYLQTITQDLQVLFLMYIPKLEGRVTDKECQSLRGPEVKILFYGTLFINYGNTLSPYSFTILVCMYHLSTRSVFMSQLLCLCPQLPWDSYNPRYGFSCRSNTIMQNTQMKRLGNYRHQHLTNKSTFKGW